MALVVIERKHLVGEITDDQALSSGAVVVGRVHAHARARNAIFTERHPGWNGFLAECAVAIVAIQFVGLRVVGDEDVGPSVAVVVKDSDTETLRGWLRKTGLLRYIFKP